MSFLDKAKGLVHQAKDKAEQLAEEHSDQIHAGIDKAAAAADKATKGRYTDTIGKAGGTAAGYVDRLAHKDDEPGGPTDTTPPTPPTPPA